MSQVATPTEPGWRPDPVGSLRVALLGRWLDQPRRQLGAHGRSRGCPRGEPRPPLLSAGARHQHPHRAPATAPAAESAATAEPVSRSARDSVAARSLRRRDHRTGPAPAAPPRRERRTPWAVLVAFFRSFADQPESYHSDSRRSRFRSTRAASRSSTRRATTDTPPSPRSRRVASSPAPTCPGSRARSRSRTSAGPASTRASAWATASVPRRSR